MPGIGVHHPGTGVHLRPESVFSLGRNPQSHDIIDHRDVGRGCLEGALHRH